jgi:hypothetical protein
MTERVQNRGTAPLNRPAPPPPPKKPEPRPAPKPAGTGKIADASTAKAGDATPDAKKVDLDRVSVPEIKTESTAKVEKAEEEQKEDKGFFGNLWGSVKSVAQDTWDGAKKVASTVAAVATTTAEVVGAGVAETTQSLAEGQGLFDSIGDGLHAGGKKLYDEVIDPTLDQSVLGQDNEFQDQGAGALGPILTNRLAVGESVDIRIEAGATIPTELIGAPNVKVDGGGTLKMKRVEALDANNQPIIGKDGKPETRIEVELQLDGRVGGSYSASVGFNGTVQAGGYEAGLKAEAQAEAEAGLTGKLNLKLRFNPDSAEEMGNLGAMMKATAATGAAVAIPGAGAVFAAMSHEDYARAMDSLPKHLESFGGEGGLYAQANASASAGVGVFKGEKDEPAGGAEKPEGNAATNFLKDQARGKAEEVEEGVLEKLQLSLGSLSASAGGEVRVGASKNFRTGERTISLTAQGAVQGEANVLGAGKGGKLDGHRKLDMVLAPDGSLKAINVQQKMTKEEFLALRSTVEDVYGRPIDEGFIARMSESDTITVNYSVKPEVLAQIKAKAASGDPGALVDAAGTVLSAAITKDRFQLEQGAVAATHRDEFALRAGFDLALGAQVGVRGGVVLGHEQESKVR